MAEQLSLAKQLFKEYTEKMDSTTDEEIIENFNRQVGNQGWGTAKASYLSAIRNQLIKRNIDFSEVGDETSISYKHKVTLKEKKIFKILENS